MKLEEICRKKMDEKSLTGIKKYEKRFKWEIEEIKAKAKEDYFISLYTNKVKYPYNQNNLLVCYLLEIVSDFDIDKEPSCTYGEYPDIDSDFLPDVKDYLKNEWIPKAFGEDYVCNIGSYTTFKLKSALIDMARVYSKSREEIQAITKNLDDKDEDGKPLTWDAALNLYPDLKKYSEENPEVVTAARKLLNRNRGTGVHAAGLIISSKPLSDFVPLMKRKDAPQASAWVEGLHGQDLQPVGLIKFDLLVIDNLLQIARCCELIKSRHNIEGICNKPGEPDWTDIEKWRNDPLSLSLANDGDSKGVFQFGSDGIRSLVKSGGVKSFEDLAAYTAIYRPGPLGMGMGTIYINRKTGKEKFNIHPLLKPILSSTYGVICYQEQIMKILNIVGEIPLKDCESLRKAISKKKEEIFAKYKVIFIKNGQKNLNCSEEEALDLWNQIQSFSEYGFNLSHAVSYTYLSAWLFYLKAHYPHEFYTSTLTCQNLSEEIKEFKTEAKVKGIETHRLDINKSKENFTLQGDVIYYGFSNVKGIGPVPAKKIVDNQPYRSFEDFLEKNGTDASVLKPLIGLRCFRDRDPVTLWKFLEYYKDQHDKIFGKKKKLEDAFAKYEEEFKELVPDSVVNLSDLKGDNPFDDEEWQKYNVDEKIISSKEVECEEHEEGAYPKEVIIESEDDDLELTISSEVVKYFRQVQNIKKFNKLNELKKLWKRRNSNIQKRNEWIQGNMPKLCEFNPDDHEIEEKLLLEFRDPELCEKKYYGFTWVHELEKSPDYKGNLTFDNLKKDEGSIGPVEIKVISVNKIVSKKGKEYWQVLAEDVNGKECKINMWSEDWARFSKEFGYQNEKLTPGNLLRVRLQSPEANWPFWLESNFNKNNWKNRQKYPDKSEDCRVVVMKHGIKEEEKFLTDEEVLEQFNNLKL